MIRMTTSLLFLLMDCRSTSHEQYVWNIENEDKLTKSKCKRSYGSCRDVALNGLLLQQSYIFHPLQTTFRIAYNYFICRVHQLSSCWVVFLLTLHGKDYHFFRNACTKSGSLRFSQFSGCWLILSVYILMSFDFPFVRLFGVR
jgi:hypothetical protein